MDSRLYILHALSSLRVGTGQSIGQVELPIMRDATTSHPVIPGSSIKGVLRAQHGDDVEGSETWKLFGPDTKNAEQYAGSLRFSDANLLCMPVRADNGVFAWVTCPLALHRLQRDTPWAAQGLKVPSVDDESALVDAGTALRGPKGKVGLLDMSFKAATLAAGWSSALSRLAFDAGDPWRALFEARLCVVTDEMFTWFAENHTEVRTHIRIEPETGVVAKGALWETEALPPETLLVGIVQAVGNGQISDTEALSALQARASGPIQVGGSATTGLGRARFVMRGERDAK